MADAELEAVGALFAEGEQRIRSLLWEVAHGGDRRRLLKEAMEVVTQMRFAAAKWPDRALAQKLDEGAQKAGERVSGLFREELHGDAAGLLRIHDPELLGHPRLGDLVDSDDDHRHPSLDYLRLDLSGPA